MKRLLLGITGWLSLILLPAHSVSASELSLDEVRAISEEAYIYGFPMVMHYKTMNAYALDEKSPEYKGQFNQLVCEARLYTPEDRTIVTPNSDTPYCMGFLDLRAEPLVLRVPEFASDRYYSFQLIDLYTHNYAYVGTLTTGNGAGDFLLTGPGWKGALPEGITEVIESETDIVFAIVRTQLFDENDLGKVADIQASYKLIPFSTYPDGAAKPGEPLVDWPKWVEGDQFDARSFTYLNYMLGLTEPYPGEEAALGRFAKIGLGTDAAFDLADLPDDVRQALEEGAKAGFGAIEAFIAEHSNDPLMSGNIFGTRKFLQTSAKKNFGLDDFYLLRAAAAHAGLYGNSAEEALYPTYFNDAAGKPLDGSERRYRMTFKKGAWPPVRSFWSLTMYDGKTQLLIDNPIDRYLVNSMMEASFVEADDGSVTFYVQADSPGEDLEANWLPAPKGPFYLVMRLYGPKKEVLAGDWTPPELVEASR